MWCSDASPVAMACDTIEASSRVIGSMPDAPRSLNEMRRGIPDGSARISSALRARRTVHTSLRTSTLMEEGSRFAVLMVRLKS